MAVYTSLPCGHTVIHSARNPVPSCHICVGHKRLNEPDFARNVADAILDDPSRDPDSDECVLARQYLRLLSALNIINGGTLEAHAVEWLNHIRHEAPVMKHTAADNIERVIKVLAALRAPAASETTSGEGRSS